MRTPTRSDASADIVNPTCRCHGAGGHEPPHSAALRIVAKMAANAQSRPVPQDDGSKIARAKRTQRTNQHVGAHPSSKPSAQSLRIVRHVPPVKEKQSWQQ